ncbi:MAG: single-stranded DNA-binding protein [Propionibacteriaceae bacterium]|jgi:single-strand DNA-binding protein|nr:single-stranded DNA-binding protein [Propionibacteriaceae bacterium]
MESTMTLTGFVGHELDLKRTRSGTPTVTFRVATTPRMRVGEDWADGTTTWNTVVCYRNLADNVALSLRKGDLVLVHGKVRTQAWTDVNGEAHERMVIEASAIGHDLSRGVTRLIKTAPRREDDREPESNNAETPSGQDDDPGEEPSEDETVVEASVVGVDEAVELELAA